MNTSECCAGHRCDRCSTCATGRCCQKDAAADAMQVWDELAVSPRLFYVSMTELGLPGRMTGPLRRALTPHTDCSARRPSICKPRPLLLGQVLLLSGAGLLDVRNFGALGLRRLADAIATLEYDCGEKSASDTETEARHLAHMIGEFAIEPFRGWFTRHDGSEYTVDSGLDVKYSPIVRLDQLATNAHAAGHDQSAAVYSQAARFTETGNLGLRALPAPECPGPTAMDSDTAQLIEIVRCDPGVRALLVAALRSRELGS